MRNGAKDTAIEKGGAIEFLSPNRRDVLATVTLHNIGINNFTISKSEAKQDAIKRVTCELYVGSMEIQAGPSKHMETLTK
jgi:hypothetical protein